MSTPTEREVIAGFLKGVRKEIPCRKCKGKGTIFHEEWLGDAKRVVCSVCLGTGRIRR